MNKLINFLFSSLVILGSVISYAKISEKDQQDVLLLLENTSKAINSGDLQQMKSYLDDKFTLITMDNRKMSSLDELKYNWNQVFQSVSTKLSKISIETVKHEPLEFIADNVVLLNGTADEHYYFIDGNVRSINTHWTAVANKVNNEWKFKQAHFSANIFDNPVLHAAELQLMECKSLKK